jgi:hypothetical protein
VLEFEKKFDQAPVEEKKELLKLCISRVVIDKDRRVARFYARKVPTGSPHLERLFEGKPAGSGMSTASARNRDDSVLPPWIKHLVFQIRRGGGRSAVQTSVT